jgi:hypothetical protein
MHDKLALKITAVAGLLWGSLYGLNRSQRVPLIMNGCPKSSGRPYTEKGGTSEPQTPTNAQVVTTARNRKVSRLQHHTLGPERCI